MVESLGHYKVLDRIGAGGIGEVYRARDTQLGRTVAIKVLAPGVSQDAERRELFLRDARAAAVLSHPNIAALYEIGEDDGRPFLVLEFVPGEPLKRVIAGRPLNPRRAVDLAIQVADALAEAHAAGVVHHDLRPDNIIVTPKGNAKILDFGFAAWTSGGAARQAAASAIAGDAGPVADPMFYLSPEEALGEQGDHRGDIFSLGIVLFEMLTGKLPFSGATSRDVVLRIVQSPAPTPSAVNPSLPQDLDAVMAKALAKSLDQRYEVAATFAAELRAIAAILDVRIASAEPTPVGRTGGSSWTWILIAVVVGFVLTAAAAWWFR